MKRPAFLSHGSAAATRLTPVPRIPSTCSTSANPVSDSPSWADNDTTQITDMKLAVGTRVRVAKSIVMYHYPGRKNTAIDVEGFEGFIASDKSSLDGVFITATAPYYVDFTETHPKFRAHFEESELQVLGDS